jgi:hypothetical protein
MNRTSSFSMLMVFPILLSGLGFHACSSGENKKVVSSRAYKGHENDLDINYFVNAYPNTVGTRLDDCQTCHRGGSFTTGSGSKIKTITKNVCDFCHLTVHPDTTGFNEPQPTQISETLNPFGQDYLAAGKNQAAVKAIESKDSDADGAANQQEIADLKYPGDDKSKPGQNVAPMKSFTMDQLKALASHQEFLLANANKQQYDTYATYQGIKIVDLLAAAGVDVSSADLQGITVIAPDGYLKDIAASKIRDAYPAGLFFAGLDTNTLGATCGFVEYPPSLPPNLTDGAAIPDEQWLMLAYSREGLPMDPSTLDPPSGKINGEGPLRLVVPQSNPSKPDRGSQYSPTNCNDGNDYNDTKDHNAGDMVKGVIAIRVNPLPAGVEDFDYRNGGWAYIANQTVLIYGFGVTP